MDAIILAGGRGTRMDSGLPKALIKLKGRPVIDYQINYLIRERQTRNTILSLGYYYSREIINYVTSKYGSYFYDFMRDAIEDEPLGTAGGLKNALMYTSAEYVLAFNCDDIADINLKELAKFKEDTICVAHSRLPFARVIEKDGYAVYEEKPLLEDWVSCGWYLLKTEGLREKLPDKGSLEYDVFPKMKLRMYKHEGFWKPINTKKDVIDFESCELPDVLK